MPRKTVVKEPAKIEDTENRAQMDLTQYVTGDAENLEVYWSKFDYPELLISKGDLLILGLDAKPSGKDLVLTNDQTIRRGAGIRLAARNGIRLVPKNDADIIGVILAVARKFRGENAKP